MLLQYAYKKKSFFIGQVLKFKDDESKLEKNFVKKRLRIWFYWAEHRRYSCGPYFYFSSYHMKFNQMMFDIKKFAVTFTGCIHWWFISFGRMKT